MIVAIVGSRGIPAKYGGFETFAEQLSTRLVKRDHQVTVTCESSGGPDKYKNVKLLYSPIPPPQPYSLRKMYAFFMDLYFVSKLGKQCDFVYLLAGISGISLLISRIFRIKASLLVNIDGIEWKRSKFSILEQLLVKFNIKCAMLFSDTIIVDAKSLKRYIKKTFHKKTIYIPYGIEEPKEIKWSEKKVDKLLSAIEANEDLMPDDYWLVVARLEPENNIHTILKGFLESEIKKPLLVVGDFTSKKYRAKINEILKKDKDKRILMVGGIYDRELLFMLRQNCFGYIHGHSVGGTNPSLLEAMVMKNLVIAHDNEFNREVGGDAILYFKGANELTELIDTVEDNPDKYVHLKQLAYARVKSNYSWDDIVDKYEKLFEEMGKSE